MNQPTRNSWQEIQNEILQRIQSRQWKPGEQIPNEVALAAEFGCARATVNRALQAVASQGWIDRRRKAGSRVASMPVRQAKLEIPVIRKQIEDTGCTYGYRLVYGGYEIPSKKVVSSMKLAEKEKQFRIKAVHLADQHPFVIEDRWINPRTVRGLDAEDFSQKSANEWLIQNAPFTDGQITLGAVNAPDHIAGLLETAKDVAIFVIDRNTWYRNRSITQVRLWYRPGYFMTSAI